MRAEVAALLQCPVCGAALALGERSLGCAAGHSFDLARQGYANLLRTTGRTPAGDTAAMVAARARFLAAGHYDPLVRAVVEAAASAVGEGEAGAVVDLGAGTGHYLAAVIEGFPGWHGLALDASKYAARAAARAHPRAGAVVCDIWQLLPVRSGSADLVLDIFAPRNAAEFTRVLAPGGTLLVATPAPEHLRELVEPLGLVTVDPDKQERLDRDLASLRMVQRVPVRFTMTLDHAAAEAAVLMGPTAHHRSAEQTRTDIAGLPDPVAVRAAVDLAVYGR